MTTALPRVRAHYHLVTPRPAPGVVAIIDMYDHDLAMTITNDAEAVVNQLKALGALRPDDRLIYRDTEGQWDELVLDRALRFYDFAPLRASTLEEAVRKVAS